MDIAALLGIDPNDPDHILAGRLVRADEDLLDALIAMRKAKRMTQADVGELMGTSQAAVARIESGERDPRLSTLRRYALAVGADVDHSVRPFERQDNRERLALYAHAPNWRPQSHDERYLAMHELARARR